LTPNITKLASSGVKADTFLNVFPTVAFTNNVTLFTGLYPENHGIISNVFKNPYTDQYFDGRIPDSYNNPNWYEGEFIWEHAEKYGILSNTICIPGSSIKSNHKSPYYFLDRNSKALPKFRIQDAINKLRYKEKNRPKLTAVYFDDIDDIGHQFGTNSDKTNEAIKNVDQYVGSIIDSLHNLELLATTNLFFISTHGMANTDNEKIINIRELLSDKNISIDNNGAYSFIYCQDKESCNADSIAAKLKNNATGIVAFTKMNIPDSLNIRNNPYMSDILVLANDGWIITEKNDFPTYGLMGIHGYSADNPDMYGVFIASGPDIEYNKTIDSVEIQDVFPLFCRLLGVNIPNNIDGKIDNIQRVLK